MEFLEATFLTPTTPVALPDSAAPCLPGLKQDWQEGSLYYFTDSMPPALHPGFLLSVIW